MYGDCEIVSDMNIWYSINEEWRYSYEEEFWPEVPEWEEEDDEWAQSRRDRASRRYLTGKGFTIRKSSHRTQ